MKSWLIAAAAAMLTVAGSAVAQERVNPVWTTRPDDLLVSDLAPIFAGFLGIRGRVEVECFITGDGHPFRCRVMREAPQGLGFGAAARLVVASGQLRAGRVDGQMRPSRIRTTVTFMAEDDPQIFGGWMGPEPSEARLALARQVPEHEDQTLSVRDQLLDGLDVDRKAVVASWVDELMPQPEELARAARTIWLARLFDEADLRRLINGQPVEALPDGIGRTAWPDLTAEEEAALNELRRRYCDRYSCSDEFSAN